MLELLRALYNPEEQFPQGDSFYAKIKSDEHTDLIASQLYFLLVQSERKDAVPSFFLQNLHRKFLQNLMLSTLIKNETALLLNVFEQHKIEAMTLKGTHFAEKYFGSLMARSTSDIDILVKPTQVNKAIHLVKQLGYSTAVPYEHEHFHKVFEKITDHFHYPLNVEIHWHFLRKRTSSLDMNQVWKAAERLGNYHYILDLSDFHAFYLTCLHGWNHELISWKYFIDIIQMIHTLGNRLNYEDLFQFARSQKTYRRIARTLAIVYHEFPHLQEAYPLPLDTGSTFWWHEADLQDDHHLKATFSILLKRIRQVNDYDTLQQKWIFLWRNALPDPVIMARIIGEDKKKLPRLIQYGMFLGKCLGEIVYSLPRYLKLLKRKKVNLK